jgi:hypothetical protein
VRSGAAWRGRARLGPHEWISLAVIAAISFLFARPLLEEWGFIVHWDTHGIAGFPDVARVHILRPFESVGSYIEWRVGHGSPFGMGVGFAVLLAARYMAARWATSPILGGNERWIAAVLAAVPFVWPATWQMRYSPSDMSSIFFLVGLGAVVRLREELRVRWVIVGALAVAVMLACYQGLILCAVLLPLAARAGVPRPLRRLDRAELRGLVRTGLPVVAGLGLYAGYAAIARASIASTAYEEELFDSGRALGSLSRFWTAVTDLYRTAFLNTGLALTLLAVFLAALVVPAFPSPADTRVRLRHGAVLAGGLLLLPLTAFPYAFSGAQRLDPDRVMFPVAFAFLLLAVVALARRRVAGWRAISTTWAAALVGILLVSTAVDAYSRHRDWTVEARVLSSVNALAAQHHASSVVVRDYSGSLGDVYRFYPPTLQQALTAGGSQVQAVLCSPPGVDRYHPVARRLSVEAVPACDGLKVAPDALLLDARPSDDGLVFSVAADAPPAEAPPASAATPTDGFAAQETGGGESWWWMTSPRGALAVTGPAGATVTVAVTLSPPPCGRVRGRFGGQPFTAAGRAPASASVTVGPEGTATVPVSAAGAGCVPQGSARRLFVAVFDPRVTTG